ncbi:MAG: hypothetical protein ACOZAO_03455 [Patescibacteria group bacterium]
MINLVALTIGSFIFTFLLSFPFLSFLYKYNIRRISKTDLDKILKHRTEMKFGTPVMGGTVILLSIILFSTVFLSNWAYYPLIIFVCVVGGIFGAIDEYVNTLGRTLSVIRIVKEQEGKPSSIFPVSPKLKRLKSLILIPWKLFEEALRITGSQQRGLKSHYKLLMQIFLALVPILYLHVVGNGTFFIFPLVGKVDFNILYYPIVFAALMFYANAFGVTDGMDGLSAGLHSIAFLAIGVISYHYDYIDLAYLSFIVVGAELAFLYFNIFPARVEMSDVGTLPLGMLFVLITSIMHLEFVLPIIGFIFTLEIFTSVTQQWSVKLTGKRLYPMAPIHHSFEFLGWPETKVTMRFWLVSAIVALVGIFIALL